jgi:hypothetical protein
MPALPQHLFLQVMNSGDSDVNSHPYGACLLPITTEDNLSIHVIVISCTIIKLRYKIKQQLFCSFICVNRILYGSQWRTWRQLMHLSSMYHLCIPNLTKIIDKDIFSWLKVLNCPLFIQYKWVSRVVVSCIKFKKGIQETKLFLKLC